MNNTFNIKRFGLVLKKDFQEKWKKYGIQFLTMFGITTVIFIFFFNDYPRDYSDSDNKELLLIASLLFLVFGVIYASTLMETMQEKTKRIAYLMIPASDFEKFFSRWLIVTVGYAIAFFIALWLADVIRVAFWSYHFPDSDTQFLDFSRLVNPKEKNNFRDYAFFSKAFFGYCISFYALLQSLFILGATFWEKSSFIKTFSAIVIVVILFLYLNWLMIKIVHHDLDNFGWILDTVFPKKVGVAENVIILTVTCILNFFTLLFWAIAFFRFRESEIIKRL